MPRPRCPNCGSQQVLPIVYGYPSHELDKEAQNGKVILGGCCITGDDPKWHCTACEHQWPGTPLPTDDREELS